MYLRPVLCTVISLLCLAAANAAFCQGTSPQPVFQSWNEIQLIVPLVRSTDANGRSVDKVTATIGGIARLGRDVELVDGRVGVVFDVRVNKHLSLLTGVLYRKDELVNNVPRYETRLGFGATLSASAKKFSIKDRNLFERRLRNGRGDVSVYRNRLRISHPVRHNDKVLFSPFISNEVYYDITGRAWIQNEFYAGISRSLSPNTVLDVAYLRNNSKPVNVNGLSLTLKITLR